MTYSAATFYIDLESGVDTARSDLVPTAYANNGSGLVRATCNSTAAYATGAVFDIAGTTGSVYNGAWKVTIIDGTHVDLQGSTFSVNPAAKGTMIPRGGSQKSDAWKTFTSGATTARATSGDALRVMASPDETSLGINATWTNNSKTITLASSLTQMISDCETAWTASANVTCTADAATFKENTKSSKSAIAGAFTTGLAAFFATGTLDLSAYKQVSFWVQNSVAIAASSLSLRLCSDVAGATPVNTIAIPALPTTATQWCAFTVDTGGALGASIKSIALYVDIDQGAGTQNIFLDNIIAVKDSTAADSISLTSLIGKVHNLPWVASTIFAANSIRQPTQTNRNGFKYKVTAGGGGSSGGSEPTWPTTIGLTVTDGALTWTCDSFEETWYPIQSINGTTVKLDGTVTTQGSSTQEKYQGTTESVATYKRECLRQTILGNFTSSNSNTLQQSGTAALPCTISGGWDRTSMAAMTGETWMSFQNGQGNLLLAGAQGFWTIQNLNQVRGLNFGSSSTGTILTYKNIHCHANSTNGFSSAASVARHICTNINTFGNSASGIIFGSEAFCKQLASYGNATQGVSYASGWKTEITNADLKGNGGWGIQCSTAINGVSNIRLINLISANNVTGGFSAGSVPVGGNSILINPNISEGIPFNPTISNYTDVTDFVQKNAATADNHLLNMGSGTIVSATDQRYTASGIAWKFLPTAVARNSFWPMKLKVAKVAVAANALVTLSIRVRRDSTDIQGQLFIAGNQLSGIDGDQTVACAPSINTWTQYSITFTPTEAGVVELEFRVWDGIGIANSLWVDDFAAGQA